MSVTNSRRIALTRPAVDYEMFGPLGSQTYKAHIANGTDRAAAIRCDCGDPFAFVERAEQLRDEHGRKVESISLIQSFEKSELDPTVAAYVQQINDLGYELGKRLAPNSDVLVITHTDSSGGHGHNHIKVMNHDNVTGRALRRDFRHFAVAEVNDELMRECNLRVVERGSRDQTKYWEHVREGATISTFDKLLGERLMEVQLDQSWSDEAGYLAALEAKGIEIKSETHVIAGTDADGASIEHESIGWTYRMLDDTRVDEGIKPRVRRRKASSLGDEFTYKSLHAAFETRQAQRAAEQAATQARAALPPLLFDDVRSGDSVKRTPSTFQMIQAGYSPEVIEQLKAAWEAEQQSETPESGVAVADQTEHIETAENSGSEAPIDVDGAVEEAHDPEVGREWVENGSVVGAADSGENGEALENEDSGSGPDGAGMATPRGAHLEPTSGSRMGVELRPVGSVSDAEDPEAETSAALELLDLRYRTITEGASWSDDEYDQVLARIDALKARLGLADAPPPSREAVLAEYEERVLGLTRPIQHEGAEPSSAPASSDTPSAPPGLDGVELHDEAAPSSPPGSSGPSPAPPGLVDAGSPSAPASVKPSATYKSGVWELVDAAKNEKVKAGMEAIARFDEDARVRLAAGERISHRDVPKGIGQQWLDEYGDRMDPVVRHEMTLRAERMAERRYEFEQVGKPLKDRLDQFGQVPNFSLDEYHDVQAKLAESNRTVKAIEQRMNAGIYEDGSKWRPGRPIPDRTRSQSMRARLHELAEQALDEQAAVEAAHDPELGG